jgi:hypothetical protein
LSGGSIIRRERMLSVLAFLKARFTKEYWTDYFDMDNFFHGMRTNKFKYKLPVLLATIIAMYTVAAVSSAVVIAVCTMVILVSGVLFATVDV